jgi:hypothetical protein
MSRHAIRLVMQREIPQSSIARAGFIVRLIVLAAAAAGIVVLGLTA